MKFALSLGPVEAQAGPEQGISIEKLEILVEYSEQEFLTMTEKYPQVIAAIFDQLNGLAVQQTDTAINRAKRKETTS